MMKRLTHILLTVATTAALRADIYPLPQGTFNYTGSMMVNPTDSTHVMMGYAVWWGKLSTNDTSWADPNRYNTTTNTTWRNTTYNDLISGRDPQNGNYPAGLCCATPLLPSAVQTATGMSAGYPSNCPAVIQLHNQQIRNLGCDIIVPDLTNNTVGQYSYAEREAGYTNIQPKAFMALMETLDNQNQDYPVTDPLRVVPCLGIVSVYSPWQVGSTHEIGDLVSDGGINYRCTQKVESGNTTKAPSQLASHWTAVVGPDLVVDTTSGHDNLSAFQRELLFTLKELQKHPKLAVCYGEANSPLVIVYHATVSYYIDAVNAQAQTLKNQGYQFTLRHMGGFTESVNGFWNNPDASATRDPNDPTNPYIRLKDTVWTWCDRVYTHPASDGFSSYTLLPGGGRGEFVAVTPKSPGWGVDTTATRGGQVIYEQTSIARRVNPVFLFLSEYKHFMSHDSCFHVETARDIEPTVEWGTAIYDMMKDAVAKYRAYQSNAGRARFTEITARGKLDSQYGAFIIGFNTVGPAGMRIVAKAMGPGLAPYMPGGTSTTVVDPILQLHNSNGLLAMNNDWATFQHTPSGDSNNFLKVRVLPNSPYLIRGLNYGQPLDAKEAAITADLCPDSSYTVVMGDAGGTNRIGHIRLVSTDTISDSRIAGMSLRGTAGNGNNTLILGFHLDRTMRICVRGSGPSLAQFGLAAVADPRLEVYRGSTMVASSWDIDPATKAQLQPRYWWTIDDREAGLANLELQAGDYTVLLYNQGPGPDGVGHIDIQEW